MLEILKKILKQKEGKKMKFEEIADEWLKYKKPEIKESTYCQYLIMIENHLKPYFKELDFNAIINYNDLILKLADKMAPSSVRDIITILKAIFKYYEEEYDCKLKIKKSTLPKSEKEEIKVFTNREKNKITDYCMQEPSLINIGMIISLNTGLRVGEICGLRWKDIDLENKKIYVRNIVKRVYNKMMKESKINISSPKSKSSIRTIPISKKLYEILKPLKKDYKPDNFFLSGTEICKEPCNCQYAFKNMLKALKIKKKYTFHNLRHTFATDCVAAGMDIKSLSELLGHSDISITLKFYVHSSDKQKKKYLEKL